jgi:hypothetical protein
LEKRETGGDLLRFRVPVLWGAALYDIADIDVLPLQVNRLKDLGEQLTCLTHKRQAMQIFLIAWAFTHKDQSGLWVSQPKNDMLSPLVESAPAAVTEILADRIKRLVSCPFVHLFQDFHRPFRQGNTLVSQPFQILQISLKVLGDFTYFPAEISVDLLIGH